MATLEDVIPDANKRKPIYQVFAGLGLVLTATQVGFSAAELSQPVALTIALAVYAFLAGAGFVLAAGNTSEPSNPEGLLEVWVEKEEPQQVPTAGSDPGQINGLETAPRGKYGA